MRVDEDKAFAGFDRGENTLRAGNDDITGEHGIRRFDPGAGSPHKVRRGFEAVANHSLHRFYEPTLSQIMAAHIDEINRLEQDQIDDLNALLPLAATSDGRHPLG